MKVTLDDGRELDLGLDPDEIISDVIVLARTVEKGTGRDGVRMATVNEMRDPVGIITVTGMLAQALQYQYSPDDEE